MSPLMCHVGWGRGDGNSEKAEVGELGQTSDLERWLGSSSQLWPKVSPWYPETRPGNPVLGETR